MYRMEASFIINMMMNDASNIRRWIEGFDEDDTVDVFGEEPRFIFAFVERAEREKGGQHLFRRRP